MEFPVELPRIGEVIRYERFTQKSFGSDYSAYCEFVEARIEARYIDSNGNVRFTTSSHHFPVIIYEVSTTQWRSPEFGVLISHFEVHKML